MPETARTTVLFLCGGNSARSIMAEAILRREGMGRVRAVSAGSRPAGQVHPHAIALLDRLGHDISGLRSKSWDEYAGPDAPEVDFVFTLCDDMAGETCPVWPGHPLTAHWGVPDPARTTGTEAEIARAFAEAYRVLRSRIALFVGLPLAQLDARSLKTRLDEIGATGDADKSV